MIFSPGYFKQNFLVYTISCYLPFFINFAPCYCKFSNMKFNKLFFLIPLLLLLLFTVLIYSQSIANNQNTSINNSNSSNPLPNKSINNYYKSANTNKIDYKKDALIKIKNKDYAGARFDYEKAITLNPKDSKLHLNYALLLVNSFNDLPNAKKHFDVSLALDPKDAKAHYDYAVVLKIFFKNNQAATNQYIIATKLKPSFITHDSDKLFGIKR